MGGSSLQGIGPEQERERGSSETVNSVMQGGEVVNVVIFYGIGIALLSCLVLLLESTTSFEIFHRVFS